jgi:predicted PurR-regulated permease PerM
MTSAAPDPNDPFLERAVETSVRLALVVLLVVLCLVILAPFAGPVAWGIIIAVALAPLHRRLTDALGGRERIAAGLLAFLGLALLIVPTLAFAGSVIDGAGEAAGHLSGGGPHVPPPPDDVRAWPLVGDRVYSTWNQASRDFSGTLERFEPQLEAFAGWLIATSAGTGIAFLQFLISIVIGGVLLAAAEDGRRIAEKLAARLVGGRGDTVIELATSTVRSVCVGVLGVAVIQATLISVGFLAVGLPNAGLWAALCLFLAVLQLPPFLVVLPTIVYVFHTEPTTVAVLFLVWELLAGFSDNVLKPILLSRGVEVPMLVIFLGSIGGFIAFGFIGLFVGAVVLSLGYRLVRAWADFDEEGTAQAPAT